METPYMEIRTEREEATEYAPYRSVILEEVTEWDGLGPDSKQIDWSWRVFFFPIGYWYFDDQEDANAFMDMLLTHRFYPEDSFRPWREDRFARDTTGMRLEDTDPIDNS